MRGAPELQKIVIRTDQTNQTSAMISMLNRVFPECEVYIMVDAKILESLDLADESLKEFKEEEHGQNLDC
jgi:hypothetical protein